MITLMMVLVISKMMVTRTCPLAIDFLLNRAEVRGWKTNVFPVYIYNRNKELEDGDDNYHSFKYQIMITLLSFPPGPSNLPRC